MTTKRVPGGVVHELPVDLRAALIASATAIAAWMDIMVDYALASSPQGKLFALWRRPTPTISEIDTTTGSARSEVRVPALRRRRDIEGDVALVALDDERDATARVIDGESGGPRWLALPLSPCRFDARYRALQISDPVEAPRLAVERVH